MFDLSDKRAMNKGFGDGMSRAFELVATPAIFAGLGYLADRALGTSPVIAVALGVFALVGMFLRMWYGYDAEMRAHEARAVWAKDRPVNVPETSADADEDLWATRRTGRTGLATPGAPS